MHLRRRSMRRRLGLRRRLHGLYRRRRICGVFVRWEMCGSERCWSALGWVGADVALAWMWRWYVSASWVRGYGLDHVSKKGAHLRGRAIRWVRVRPWC